MSGAVTEDSAQAPSFRELAEILTLLLALVYIPFILFLDPSENGFLWGDCAYYQLALDSLVEDGDLAVANNLPHDALVSSVDQPQLALGQSGDVVPKHQLLLVFLAYPAYRVLGAKGLLVFNVACTVALLIGILALCVEWVEPREALCAAFLFGVATLFLAYIYNYSPDILTTAFLVWSVVCTRQRRFFAAALLLALSVSVKVSSLPAASGVALVIAWQVIQERPSRRIVAAVMCGLVLGILPYAASNLLLFGSPLESGYSHIAMPSAAGGYEDYALQATHFNRPWLRGMWDVLFSFPQGLFVSNPLLLAVIGFPALARFRRDPFLLLLLLAGTLQVVVIAKYSMWNTSAFSNRFLMPTVAFLSPHVALVLAPGVRKLLARASR
jgi:hypothetical protein